MNTNDFLFKQDFSQKLIWISLKIEIENTD